MPVTKAQQKAVAKYMQKSYDDMKIRIGKGGRDKIKAHAAAMDESLNEFLNRAINETMERDLNPIITIRKS